MIDPAIEKFFDERKEAWLKKNTKSNMDDLEKLEKVQECNSIFELENWLPNAARRAGQISISSHPCTFSHPSARKNKNGYVSSIIASSKHEKDGFLRTGNLNIAPDALGNAAALDVYKFLTLEMQDNQTLLVHIQHETELAKGLLNQEASNYNELREGFLKMIESDDSIITSSKIKQVYFPIDDGEYHLLSILTNSSMLFEQRKRIDNLRYGDSVKEARECRKSGKYHRTGYQEIFGITTIGYGGTKPQNISVLNNSNAGKAHLLLSVPPKLQTRNIRLPKTDFFKDSLNPWDAKEILEKLHKLMLLDINNKNIRDGRDYHIQAYVDLIIAKMWQVRLFLDDYSGDLSSQLFSVQKIWLYPEHNVNRSENSEWLDTVIRQISQSLIRTYIKVVAKPVKLADEELLAIEKIVEQNREALR